VSSILALSPDQMRARSPASRIAEMDKPTAQAIAADTALTESELADQQIQRRLSDAGLLSEIKPPIRDLATFRDREAVPIQGGSLSETVVRERR
jgi:hypothetical protein